MTPDPEELYAAANDLRLSLTDYQKDMLSILLDEEDDKMLRGSICYLVYVNEENENYFLDDL